MNEFETLKTLESLLVGKTNKDIEVEHDGKVMTFKVKELTPMEIVKINSLSGRGIDLAKIDSDTLAKVQGNESAMASALGLDLERLMAMDYEIKIEKLIACVVAPKIPRDFAESMPSELVDEILTKVDEAFPSLDKKKASK